MSTKMIQNIRKSISLAGFALAALVVTSLSGAAYASAPDQDAPRPSAGIRHIMMTRY